MSFHFINSKFVCIISSNTVCELGFTVVKLVMQHLNLELISYLSLNYISVSGGVEAAHFC